MTSPTHTITDSVTMLRRELLHQKRYPSVTVMVVFMPVTFLLLFVYVFGGTMGAGLGAISGGRAQYLEYVVPGILLIAIASVAQGTSISVATDMTEGIVARFRTMAISRGAVLCGHVGGAMIQTILGLVAVMVIALLIGFRPNASAIEWLATAGVLTMVAFAFSWLAVGAGAASKTVESSSNVLLPLLLLPFLGSGFVPTDSMPTAVRWFAEYQPFTPFIETVRGLMTGTAIGHSATMSVVWCLALSVGGYLWARSSYDRRSV